MANKWPTFYMYTYKCIYVYILCLYILKLVIWNNFVTQKTSYRIYVVFFYASASECFLLSFRATWGHKYCEREICSFKSTWSLLKTWSGAADRLPPDVWRQATLASSSPPAPYWKTTLCIEDCGTQKKSVEFIANEATLGWFFKTETLLKVFLLQFIFFWNLSETPKTNKKKLFIAVVMTARWISNLNTSQMTLWFLL